MIGGGSVGEAHVGADAAQESQSLWERWSASQGIGMVLRQRRGSYLVQRSLEGLYCSSGKAQAASALRDKRHGGAARRRQAGGKQAAQAGAYHQDVSHLPPP
jgi:hypothetical protein